MQRLGEILREMFSGFFDKKTADAETEQQQQTYTDPLDVHGDGSIREGDPMYDVMMKAFETGQPVIGVVSSAGDVVEIDDESELERRISAGEFADADVEFLREALQQKRQFGHE